MFGFGLHSNSFLGIDIGTFSIKVVELRKRGNALRLANYGEVKTALARKKQYGSSEKSNLLIADVKVAKAIQAICQEAKVQAKEGNFSIPDFSSFFTNFEIPKMSAEEIPEAIRYEVRPYVPLPLSEITLDWTVTEGRPSRTPLKVLVVAVPNEVVNQYREIAQRAGLKIRALEPEVFALARVIARDEKKSVVGIIDIGGRSTTCSIIDKGILKTSYSFNIASNELSERLAAALGVDYSKAEELKEKYGLLSDGKAEGYPQSVKGVLIPSIDLILTEIKKTFRNFYRDEGKEVEKVILSGGLTLMPGLKDYFFAELKKEIKIADPFSDISYSPILSKTLRKKGPSYAIAVGLALKGFE